MLYLSYCLDNVAILMNRSVRYIGCVVDIIDVADLIEILLIELPVSQL